MLLLHHPAENTHFWQKSLTKKNIKHQNILEKDRVKPEQNKYLDLDIIFCVWCDAGIHHILSFPGAINSTIDLGLISFRKFETYKSIIKDYSENMLLHSF